MSNHIEQRANLWYAVLIIPKDVREVIGKMKFIQSLGTPSRREALTRAAPLVALWRTQIDEARGNVGAVANEALRWQGYLKTATGVEKDVLEEQLYDKAMGMVNREGEEKAGDFYQVAMGYKTPLESHYEKWVAQISLVPKTRDQTVKDVNVFIKRFKTIEQVTKQNTKKWTEEIIQAGHSAGTANRLLISSRNYWNYLRQQDVVGVDNEPLTLRGLLPTVKKKHKKGYIPFEPEAVVRLWKEAKLREDQSLADLIFLGAYTGARIEEICSLKLEHISDKSIKIVDSKTKAGVREIPLHSKLEETIRRLKDSSTDGYLLSGLTFNKYGDRSNNLGKRFGKLKTELGYANRLEVFHSIRKTLTTLMENAGVPENVAADIVGHEKTSITYGLYSGGNVLDIKKNAIEKASYPF